jgi:hypothetical protein
LTILEQIDHALNDKRVPARQRLELADKLLTQLLDLVGALRQEVKSEVRG